MVSVRKTSYTFLLCLLFLFRLINGVLQTEHYSQKDPLGTREMGQQEELIWFLLIHDDSLFNTVLLVCCFLDPIGSFILLQQECDSIRTLYASDRKTAVNFSSQTAYFKLESLDSSDSEG